MRIAFIGQKGIPAIGEGVEKHVENLAVRLAEMGHEVFVYTRNDYAGKKLKEYEGVNLIHLPCLKNKNLETISHVFVSSLHSIFQKYDVIHYQSIGPASLCFLPKFFKRKSLVVTTFHSRDYLDKNRGIFAKKYLKFSEKIACKFSDRVIVISKNIRNYVFSKYKVKTTCIPNGSLIAFNPSMKALERWELKENKYVLSVGKFSKKKGVQNLVEAFKKLEDTTKLPNGMKLMIVIDDDEKCVKEFERMTGGRKNIIFSHNQTRATLEQLFSHAYLFVQPFESEGLSIPLLEAMGYGLAVLSANDPESKEVLGNSGTLFNPNSHKDLEDKLAFLLNKSQAIDKMGKLSKERIQKEFSWEQATRKNLRIYELNQKSTKKIFLKKIEAQHKSYV